MDRRHARVVVVKLSTVMITGQSRMPEAAPRPQSAFGLLGYALPALLVWSMYLVSFWPGLMSNDSIDQWSQALTGQYNDWHPVFHTLYIKLWQQLEQSPATVAWAQVVLLALTSGWLLWELEHFSIPRPVLWLTAILFALSPANGIMAITLWKDVPFSIAIGAFSALLLRIVACEGRELRRPGLVAALGVIGAMVALFRHNGIATVLGTFGVMALVYRSQWQPVLAGLTLSLGLWLGVRGPLYDWVGASRQTQPGLLWPVLHQIGAQINAGTPLSEQERGILNNVLPVEPSWLYVCTRVDPIAFDPALNRQWASEHLPQLARVAFDLAMRNPGVALSHLRCNSMQVLQVSTPAPPLDYYETAAVSFDVGGTALTQSVIDPAYAQRPGPIIPLLHSVAAWVNPVVRWSLTSAWQAVFWRSALYLYLGSLSCLIASMRLRDARVWIVFVPAAITVSLLIPLTVGQAFRLVYPMYLIGFLLLPLASAKSGAQPNPVVGHIRNAQ